MKRSCTWLLMVAMAGFWGCGGGASKEPKADGKAPSGTEAAVKPVEDAPQAVSPAKSAAADLNAFVPEGYEILDTAFGDLNLDPHQDAIMVLKSKAEAHNEDMESLPRPVLILTRRADQSWELAGRNDNVVMGAHDGGVFGDPWNGITIKNGYFSLEHYGGSNWRWTRIITFKYDAAKKGWFLHKDGGDEYNTSDPENVTSSVRTTKDFGVVKFHEFELNDGE